MTIILPTTLAFVGAAGLFHSNPTARLLFAVIIVCILSFRSRSFTPCARFVLLVTFFCAPMFFIHGIFNVQFPLDSELLGILYRSKGVWFAFIVSSRIAIFVAIALSWYQLNADYIIDAFAQLRVPMLLVAVTAQSISLISHIPRQAQAILLAQQSRGIETGPGLLKRMKALPTIVLPLISKLLIDTEPRSVALASRGFASCRMSTPSVHLVSSLDIFLSMFAMLCGLVVWVLLRG